MKASEVKIQRFEDFPNAAVCAEKLSIQFGYAIIEEYIDDNDEYYLVHIEYTGGKLRACWNYDRGLCREDIDELENL